MMKEFVVRFGDLPTMRIDTMLDEAIALIEKALKRGTPLTDADFPTGDCCIG